MKIQIIYTLIIILTIIYLTNSNEEFDSSTIYRIIGLQNPSSIGKLDNLYFTNNIVDITTTDGITPKVTVTDKSGSNIQFPVTVESYNIKNNVQKVITYKDNKYNVILLKLNLNNPKEIIHVYAFDPTNPIKELPTEPPLLSIPKPLGKIQKELLILHSLQASEKQKIKEAQQIQKDLELLQAKQANQAQIVQKDIKDLQLEASKAQKLQTDILTKAKQYLYNTNNIEGDKQQPPIDLPYLLE
jgi:hypothetical protein